MIKKWVNGAVVVFSMSSTRNPSATTRAIIISNIMLFSKFYMHNSNPISTRANPNITQD